MSSSAPTNPSLKHPDLVSSHLEDGYYSTLLGGMASTQAKAKYPPYKHDANILKQLHQLGRDTTERDKFEMSNIGNGVKKVNRKQSFSTSRNTTNEGSQ